MVTAADLLSKEKKGDKLLLGHPRSRGALTSKERAFVKHALETAGEVVGKVLVKGD